MADLHAVTYSDFSEAIQLVFASNRFIPKMERRLGTIVGMVNSSIPIPRQNEAIGHSHHGRVVFDAASKFLYSTALTNGCRQYAAYAATQSCW
jgi:hypothetical protein